MNEKEIALKIKSEASQIRLSAEATERILARLTPTPSPYFFLSFRLLAPVAIVAVVLFWSTYNPISNLENQVREVENLTNSLEQINI